MRSWHKTAAIGLLAIALAIAGSLAGRRPTSSPEAIFNRVSDRLMCRCGCNQNLSNCNHHPCSSADPARAQIRAAIAAGKGEEEIVRQFVQQYGAAILALPPARGFALTAWIMPVAAVLLGLGVIYRLVTAWRARLAATAARAAAVDGQRDELLKRYGAAIEEELEREA